MAAGSEAITIIKKTSALVDIARSERESVFLFLKSLS